VVWGSQMFIDILMMAHWCVPGWCGVVQGGAGWCKMVQGVVSWWCRVV